MINSKLRAWFEKRYKQWMDKHLPPRDSVTLNRRNIFILPTSNGLMFAVFTVAIFLSAINYEVSLAFGLTFFMVSIAIVAMLHTFTNLRGLTLSGLPTKAVFSGEDVGFQVMLSRHNDSRHESLELNFPKSTPIHVDLVEHDQLTVSVFTKTKKRGRLRAPRLRIASSYPLGLFKAWSVIDLDMQCMVYPKPIQVSLQQIRRVGRGTAQSTLTTEGVDDFHGLRAYVPGDSLRQVAWKNVARGQGMLVKQFVDYVDDRLLLDWDMFYGFSLEGRLSRLCHCTLELAETEVAYGLKLPGIEIEPGKGIAHKQKVLETLAFFRLAAEVKGEG